MDIRLTRSGTWTTSYVQAWDDVFSHHPENWALLTYEGGVVGYLSVLAFPPDIFDRVVDGELDELEACALEEKPSPVKDIYVSMLLVEPGHRRRGLPILLKAFEDIFQNHEAAGTPFRIGTVASTREGANLATRRFKMHPRHDDPRCPHLATQHRQQTQPMFWRTRKGGV